MLENPISNQIIIMTIAIIAVCCILAIIFIKNLAKNNFKEKE